MATKPELHMHCISSRLRRPVPQDLLTKSPRSCLSGKGCNSKGSVLFMASQQTPKFVLLQCRCACFKLPGAQMKCLVMERLSTETGNLHNASVV